MFILHVPFTMTAFYLFLDLYTKCLWKGTSQLIPPTHRRTVSELVKRISWDLHAFTI